MTSAVIKNGYNAWYKDWSQRSENKLMDIPVLSAALDGERVEILDTHTVNGEQFCTVKAPGLIGSIHSQWLEVLE